jgi:hypothetical protein
MTEDARVLEEGGEEVALVEDAKFDFWGKDKFDDVSILQLHSEGDNRLFNLLGEEDGNSYVVTEEEFALEEDA